MEGLTLDTGALVALERREKRMWWVILRAQERKLQLTVPAAVVVEWWRGQRGPAARMLDAMHVEPLSDRMARLAGEALGRIGGRGPGATDAVVMASAAQRDDVVYTSDVGDLTRFAAIFPAVRVLRV